MECTFCQRNFFIILRKCCFVENNNSCFFPIIYSFARTSARCLRLKIVRQMTNLTNVFFVFITSTQMPICQQTHTRAHITLTQICRSMKCPNAVKCNESVKGVTAANNQTTNEIHHATHTRTI